MPNNENKPKVIQQKQTSQPKPTFPSHYALQNP